MEFEFWTFAVSAASVAFIYLTAFVMGALARYWHGETIKLRIELARQPDLIRSATNLIREVDADQTLELKRRAIKAERELVEINCALEVANKELGVGELDALQFITYARLRLVELAANEAGEEIDANG